MLAIGAVGSWGADGSNFTDIMLCSCLWSDSILSWLLLCSWASQASMLVLKMKWSPFRLLTSCIGSYGSAQSTAADYTRRQSESKFQKHVRISHYYWFAFCFVFVFQDNVSLCRPSCLQGSTCLCLGLKACTTTAWHYWLLTFTLWLVLW